MGKSESVRDNFTKVVSREEELQGVTCGGGGLDGS